MSSSSFFVSVFQKFEGVACVQSVGSYVAVFEESLTKATKFGKTEVKRKAREREKTEEAEGLAGRIQQLNANSLLCLVYLCVRLSFIVFSPPGRTPVGHAPSSASGKAQAARDSMIQSTLTYHFPLSPKNLIFQFTTSAFSSIYNTLYHFSSLL